MNLIDSDQAELILRLVECFDDSVISQSRSIHYDEEFVDLILELSGSFADRCIADIAFFGDLLT